MGGVRQGLGIKVDAGPFSADEDQGSGVRSRQGLTRCLRQARPERSLHLQGIVARDSAGEMDRCHGKRHQHAPRPVARPLATAAAISRADARAWERAPADLLHRTAVAARRFLHTTSFPCSAPSGTVPSRGWRPYSPDRRPDHRVGFSVRCRRPTRSRWRAATTTTLSRRSSTESTSPASKTCRALTLVIRSDPDLGRAGETHMHVEVDGQLVVAARTGRRRGSPPGSARRTSRWS
ncbi:MAG: hypothetical protein JWM27_4292 [Gemmatimonadetes bacterium]|nr:hypothetical protein [Gemmatimonadota bacterium]